MSTNEIENSIFESLNEMAKEYGLQCDSVFFTSLIPPPNVTYEFEKVVCSNLSQQVKRKEKEESLSLQKLQNEFTITETVKLMNAYSGVISCLAPHLATKEGKLAITAVSDPNFFVSMRHITNTMKPILPSETETDSNN